MPELPEVETTVRDLKKAQPKILGALILDVWSDAKNLIKKPKSFSAFKKEILKRKILKIWRRGKNIIFTLDRKNLLIHQKLTGHLLYGKWEKKGQEWVSQIKGPLAEDPMNRFLHLIFFLDNKYQLALSDLRKFAKVEILSEKELKKELSKIGPEPLGKEKFLEHIAKTLKITIKTWPKGRPWKVKNRICPYSYLVKFWDFI
ncbi:MAG TPA: hypothetical protein EYP21_11285 [Syntrophaceae bacterium]|nr:hypothetical protein [Syntrophaceae bacterium]